MESIITIKNITKVYQLYNKPIDRLKEFIRIPRKIYHSDFYALNDISFDVEKGDSIGIIGVNGSGKSTLLKIVTGVLQQTSGEVKVNGKVAALLELGAGFNMDYTGIENIFMNGLMMGFSKKEMEEKLDSILEFADIGDFVYQPVKIYSSGMFVRLAFALSIAVEPEILIVDEALSVGDLYFQAKCYQRMDELKKNGTTILMVTHDLGTVLKYCDKAVVLHKGSKVSEGSPKDMVDLYKKILAGQYDKKILENVDIDDEIDSSVKKASAEKSDGNNTTWKSNISINKEAIDKIYGDDKAEIIDFGIFDEKGELTNVLVKNEKFVIKQKIKIKSEIKDPIFTFTIKDKKGQDLTGTNTILEKAFTGVAKENDIYEVEFSQIMNLQGGEYLLSMSCTSFEGSELKVHHRMYNIVGITVLSNKNTVGIFDINSIVKITKNGNSL